MSFKVGRQKTGCVNILPPAMVPNGPPECCFTFHLIVCLVSMVLHLENLFNLNKQKTPFAQLGCSTYANRIVVGFVQILRVCFLIQHVSV